MAGETTITIAEIAAEAGVSVPTVSKVLNGRPDVSAATRARVEAVIDRHQYRRRRTRTATAARLIDLVIHELDFAWAVELIKGVEQVAGPARAGVVLSELGGAPRPPPAPASAFLFAPDLANGVFCLSRWARCCV